MAVLPKIETCQPCAAPARETLMSRPPRAAPMLSWVSTTHRQSKKATSSYMALSLSAKVSAAFSSALSRAIVLEVRLEPYPGTSMSLLCRVFTSYTLA